MGFLQPKRTQRIKPPSRLKPVLFKVVGVIVLLVAVEGGARGCVDSVTARSIDGRVTGVGKVSVQSGDLPASINYLFLGGLKNGSITFRDIVATPVNIAMLRVGSADLRFSRGKLISGKARLDGKPPYGITVFLSPKNLGDALDASVTFQSNYLVATVEGHNMHVVPKLEGRTIVVEDDRDNRYEIELPGDEYLPCDPESIGVGGGIWISCTSDELPPVVAAAVK